LQGSIVSGDVCAISLVPQLILILLLLLLLLVLVLVVVVVVASYYRYEYDRYCASIKANKADTRKYI
jgi:uncharacterized Tic20 family protein